MLGTFIKPKWFLTLVWCSLLCSCCVLPSASGAEPLSSQLEAIAQTNTHFSLTVIVHNRRLRLETSPVDNKNQPHPLFAAQLRLVQELRALGNQRPALAELLKSPDPRVRTLAMGALFQREDGRDLPLIATLLGDNAPTFPDLHESMNAAGGPSRMAELETAQTVGQVAQAMIRFWEVPLREMTTSAFEAYWKKYENRQSSASWFQVKMNRATRRTTPIQPEYRMDVQKVVAEINQLLSDDREWTRLYVLSASSWSFISEGGDDLVSEKEVVATAKKLGPEKLMRFLQHQSVSTDPDLQMDKSNQRFLRISGFILSHADQLLRAEHAETLLVCENTDLDVSGVNPLWSIGAAKLQPSRAAEILRPRLLNEKRSYVNAAGVLAGALWRIRGATEKDFLAEWFYAARPSGSAPGDWLHTFLRDVRAAGRPDTGELLQTLVRHPRFSLTDWGSLNEILRMVNAGRTTPLVSLEDVYRDQPGSMADQKAVLSQWRNLLRREYHLPEETLASRPEPKRVLTEPAYSVSLTNVPERIVLSEDGKSLATLIDGTVEIRDAASGKSIWQIPGRPWPWRRCVAFQKSGLVTLSDQDGLLSDWDLSMRRQVRQTELTGKPHSGVDQGPQAFDRSVLKLGYAGYNHIACFDVKTGQALWLHEGDAGVGVVLAVSEDGAFLAAGGGSDSTRTVKMFHSRNGAVLREFNEHAGRVTALAFAPDGSTLATTSAEDGPRLWEVETGKLRREYAYPAAPEARTLVFSPDGRWVAIVGTALSQGGARVGIFSVASGEFQWEIRLPAEDLARPPMRIVFAPDGHLLYTATRQLAAWELK